VWGPVQSNVLVGSKEGNKSEMRNLLSSSVQYKAMMDKEEGSQILVLSYSFICKV